MNNIIEYIYNNFEFGSYIAINTLNHPTFVNDTWEMNYINNIDNITDNLYDIVTEIKSSTTIHLMEISNIEKCNEMLDNFFKDRIEHQNSYAVTPIIISISNCKIDIDILSNHLYENIDDGVYIHSFFKFLNKIK